MKKKKNPQNYYLYMYEFVPTHNAQDVEFYDKSVCVKQNVQNDNNGRG